MTSSSRNPRGQLPLFLRLAIIIVLALATVLFISSGAASEFLRAIDFLAPKPGLSGLFLVFLAPVGFMLVVALGAWLVRGLRARRELRKSA